MNLNNLEKVARQLFKAHNTAEHNNMLNAARLSSAEQRSLKQWQTSSQIAGSAPTRTMALTELGWLT